MPGELSRLKVALDEWISAAPDTRANSVLFARDIRSILERADQLKAEAEAKVLTDFFR